MRKNFNLASTLIWGICVARLFLQSPSCQAEIIGYEEIGPNESLIKLETIVTLGMEKSGISSHDTLAVFDWDNTLTAKDGTNEPRDGAKEAFIRLQSTSIKTLVLTSRLGGKSSSQYQEAYGEFSLRQASVDMHAQFGNGTQATEQTILCTHAITSCDFSQSAKTLEFKHAHHTFSLVNNIFFAGGSLDGCPNKGIALRQLLVSDAPRTRPKLIIFFDDVKANLLSVALEFKERPEKVLLVYVYHADTFQDPRNISAVTDVIKSLSAR